MDDLTAFVAARLDEDEQRAESMQHEPDVDDTYYCCPATRTEPVGDLEWGEDACTCGLARRKARVLREVAAGRAILTRYQDHLARMEDPGYPQAVARDQAREYEDYVLPALAAIWNDHPDYRPEWKP